MAVSTNRYDGIVEVIDTDDLPFIDPRSSDKLMDAFRAQQGADEVAFMKQQRIDLRNFTETSPLAVDLNAFKAKQAEDRTAFRLAQAEALNAETLNVMAPPPEDAAVTDLKAFKVKQASDLAAFEKTQAARLATFQKKKPTGDLEAFKAAQAQEKADFERFQADELAAQGA
jgi:hypothetical protein